MKFTVLNHIIIQNNKIDSTALSSFKQLQNSSPKVDALSKILKFRPFSDDHKNFIFKDRGVKFNVLNHIIIQNNKIDSTALSSFKQLQNSSPKVEALSKILKFRPFSDDHKNFIFQK